MRRSTLVAILTAAALLAGCGGSDDDEDDARAAVEDFTAALEAGDAGDACALFSASTLEDLEVSGSCEEVMSAGFDLLGDGGLELPNYEVTAVSVEDDRAEVELSGGGAAQEPLVLVREDDSWKVEGASSVDQLHPDDPLGSG